MRDLFRQGPFVIRCYHCVLRGALPVCSRARGGSEERPRCQALSPGWPASEQRRPVFLLLSLPDGPPDRHPAAVCPEERTRWQVGAVALQSHIICWNASHEIFSPTSMCSSFGPSVKFSTNGSESLTTPAIKSHCSRLAAPGTATPSGAGCGAKGGGTRGSR